MFYKAGTEMLSLENNPNNAKIVSYIFEVVWAIFDGSATSSSFIRLQQMFLDFFTLNEKCYTKKERNERMDKNGYFNY